MARSRKTIRYLRIVLSPSGSGSCGNPRMGAVTAFSSGRAQGATREEEIVPGLRLVGQGSQQVGRMVGDHERPPAIRVHAPTQAAEGRTLVSEQSRGRRFSEGDDHLRI